jgi:hypothetical protein
MKNAGNKNLMIKAGGFVFLFGVVIEFTFAQIPIGVGGELPVSVNNATGAFFPLIFNQGGRESCAHAAGIGYVFTYEINAVRNVSGTVAGNNYPFFYTYDFLNDGSEQKGTERMFLDAWKIGRENGIANLLDFGESDLTSTRWVSGYERYFRTMQNRVEGIDSLEMVDTNSLRKMKQWLYDHGNGSTNGGLFLFNAFIYGAQETRVPSGVEAGKSFFKYWGTNHDSTSRHAMTIVGYNDSVRLDFNGDSKFTNTLDISDHDGNINARDGKADPADWEIGALIVANSWGASWGDNGFAYAPYRSMFIASLNGGILNNRRIYYITVKKDYKPKMALMASITDTLRNTIALAVGVSLDPQATVPSKIRSFEKQFTYAGGAYPMCGKGASPSIEVGLDVSDLLDSIGNGNRAAFFLVVDSKAKGGSIDSLSLMEYTSGPLTRTKSSRTNVALAPGSSLASARTCVGVAWQAAGIADPGRRAPANQYIQIETRDGIRLRVPGGVKKLAVLNAHGEQCPSVLYEQDGGWISVKGKLPPALYFVSVTMRNGRSFIRKIIEP